MNKGSNWRITWVALTVFGHVAVRSDPCVLCAEADLDAQLVGVDWPISVQSCAELSLHGLSFEADTKECRKVQIIGQLCGCTHTFANHTSTCRLACNMTEHHATKPLPFLAPEFDGITPTCQMFDAYVTSLEANDLKCFQAQWFRAACGCLVADNACKFCGGDSLLNPDLPLPQYQTLFDTFQWHLSPTCDLLQAVSSQFDRSEENCIDAQERGAVCGCQETELLRRKRTIVWLPRVSAVLSFIGSLFIILSVSREKQKTIQHYLLFGLSSVDCLSSVAWSFSTLPIPKYDENGFYNDVYGANGSDSACNAQAFFIQLGLASPFFNLSLAVYYALIIIRGWNDRQIARYKVCLVGIPVLLGVVLAGAAFPYFGRLVTMCYVVDHQLLFLVVPISIVMLLATAIMTKIYIKVHRQERRVRRSRLNVSRNLSRTVFWQGFWYLMCFYASWPIVIAFVFVDTGLYENYWFQCVFVFVAPLQGFLNAIAYARLRLLGFLKEHCVCLLRKNRMDRLETPFSTGEQTESNDNGKVVVSAPELATTPVDLTEASAQPSENQGNNG